MTVYINHITVYRFIDKNIALERTRINSKRHHQSGKTSHDHDTNRRNISQPVGKQGGAWSEQMRLAIRRARGGKSSSRLSASGSGRDETAREAERGAGRPRRRNDKATSKAGREAKRKRNGGTKSGARKRKGETGSSYRNSNMTENRIYNPQAGRQDT